MLVARFLGPIGELGNCKTEQDTFVWFSNEWAITSSANNVMIQSELGAKGGKHATSITRGRLRGSLSAPGKDRKAESSKHIFTVTRKLTALLKKYFLVVLRR